MKAKPQLKIVYRKPGELKPDPRNVRKHSKQQIELIRGSIRQFGFTNPILLKAKSVVGAGHARLQAAILEELPLVPTITLEGLTPKQWRAYMIADNNLASVGSTWDKALLGEELAALKGLDIDLGSLGFSTGELASLGVAGFKIGKGDSTDLAPTEISIIIICKSEAHQEALLKRFTKEGLQCRALL
jgi:ParB-like chromosome segregation protein Spo0J